MKTIFVFTSDYRSYSNTPLDGVETIPVEVADDFQGGNKTYYPQTGEWVQDPIILPSEVEMATQKRDSLISEANAITSDWKIELQLGIISDEDKAKLTAWMLYIKALKALDLSKAPTITWPEKPAY